MKTYLNLSLIQLESIIPLHQILQFLFKDSYQVFNFIGNVSNYMNDERQIIKNKDKCIVFLGISFFFQSYLLFFVKKVCLMIYNYKLKDFSNYILSDQKNLHIIQMLPKSERSILNKSENQSQHEKKLSHRLANRNSSSSSEDCDSKNRIKSSFNFNSGQGFGNDQTSKDSQSSDNETENFIKAEFKGINQIQGSQNFKLFVNGQRKMESNNKFKYNNSIENKDTAKQKNIKRPVYDTAFFQITVEDETNPNQLSIQANKNAHKYNFTHQLTQTQSDQSNFESIKPQTFKHHYNELQKLQQVIMSTLKQKQREISLLQKQVEQMNQAKLSQFKINQQLQRQLEQLRRNQQLVEKIKKSDNVQSWGWKPKNTQELKLAIKNQQLCEQLIRREKQYQQFKKIQRQLLQEEIVLRQSLHTAFRTRKQHIKSLTNQNEKNITLNPNERKHNNNQSSQRPVTLSRNLMGNKNKSRQPNPKKLQARTQNKSQKQKQNMDMNRKENSQRQLLLKLLSDFSQLKTKIDQSLTKDHIQHSKSSTKQKKPKRRVVYAIK